MILMYLNILQYSTKCLGGGLAVCSLFKSRPWSVFPYNDIQNLQLSVLSFDRRPTDSSAQCTCVYMGVTKLVSQ